ncbi:MAG: hypothetical protein LCH56_13425 [Proteobacteria bacterium]|nr:hypothetical protein [Pseudomonadota bacterium]
MTRIDRRQFVGSALAATALTGMPALAQGEPIRIAYIDPLSGPFANVGDNGLNLFLRQRLAIEQTARRGQELGRAGGVGGLLILRLARDEEVAVLGIDDRARNERGGTLILFKLGRGHAGESGAVRKQTFGAAHRREARVDAQIRAKDVAE